MFIAMKIVFFGGSLTKFVSHSLGLCRGLGYLLCFKGYSSHSHHIPFVTGIKMKSRDQDVTEFLLNQVT